MAPKQPSSRCPLRRGKEGRKEEEEEEEAKEEKNKSHVTWIWSIADENEFVFDHYTWTNSGHSNPAFRFTSSLLSFGLSHHHLLGLRVCPCPCGGDLALCPCPCPCPCDGLGLG